MIIFETNMQMKNVNFVWQYKDIIFFGINFKYIYVMAYIFLFLSRIIDTKKAIGKRKQVL